MNDANAPWPELPPLDDWADTFATVHMWTQIVGKIRLALSPWQNHSCGKTGVRVDFLADGRQLADRGTAEGVRFTSDLNGNPHPAFWFK